MLPLNDYAIVDIGKKEYLKIEAPDNKRLSLHLSIISYLNSAKFKNYNKSTRYSICRSIKKFFSYLERFEKDDDLSFDLISDFIHYSKRNYSRENELYGMLSHLKVFLRWGISDKSEFSDSLKFFLKKLYVFSPVLSKPVNKSRLSLSQIFENCPYNDTQLLSSLIKLCIWIINYESEFRYAVNKMKRVSVLINNMQGESIYEAPLSYGNLSNDAKRKNYAKEIYGALIADVREYGTLSMKERLVSEISHPFGDKKLSENELDWVLNKSTTYFKKEDKENAVTAYSRLNQGKREIYSLGSFKVFSFKNVMVLSDVEIFAMYCLLSSEKCNPSSVLKLEIDDFVENSNGVQFQIQKTRRPESDRANLTLLHTKGSSIGCTYLNYIKGIRRSQKYYNEKDCNKVVPFHRDRVKNGFIGGGANNEVDKYFRLLLSDKSYIRDEVIKAFDGEEELKPIFWLLSNIVEKNISIADLESNLYKNKKSSDDKVIRSSIVKDSAVGLNSSYIRQSAIISEDAALMESVETFKDRNVIAQSSNHSLDVHLNIYIDRSTTREKVEADRKFAYKIGGLMERDAGLMRELVQKSCVFDYNEALEALGLPREDETSSSRLAKEIERLGIDIDLMDSFKSYGRRIFIANKMTVALIIKYLEHIRESFDDLVNDDSKDLRKATLAARDYFYLSKILQKFPVNIREEGERYSIDLSFNYANLSDIVGVSNE